MIFYNMKHLLSLLEYNKKIYENNLFVNVRQYFENLIDEIKK